MRGLSSWLVARGSWLVLAVSMGAMGCGSVAPPDEQGGSHASLQAKLKSQTLSTTETVVATVTVTETVTETSTGSLTLTQTQTSTATQTQTATGNTTTRTATAYNSPVSATNTGTVTDRNDYVAAKTYVWTATLTRADTAGTTFTKTVNATGTYADSGVTYTGSGTATANLAFSGFVTSTTTQTVPAYFSGQVSRTLPATGTGTGHASVTWTYTKTSTGQHTDTLTLTLTQTLTQTATATSTSTFTQTNTATNTVTHTGTAASTGTSVTACLQGWRNTGCGEWCTRETQADRMHCTDFLDCYFGNNTGPSTNPDGTCGVNHFNYGMAPKIIADQVYQCLACPGTMPVTVCSGLPDGTPCTDRQACTANDRCVGGGCVPGANTGGPCDGCACGGIGPNGEGISAVCGQSACGRDGLMHSCSSVGWASTGQPCPACQCAGTTENGGTVATTCGQSACDTAHTRVYTCSESGWVNSGEPCFQCTGVAPDLPLATAWLGETVCGTDSSLHMCTQAGWASTGADCGSCEYRPDRARCDDGNPETSQDSCRNRTCVGVSPMARVVPADQGDTVQSELPGGFSVSGSGAATYVIPLDIPAGRAGISPQLALTYSSAGGDGMVGVGWKLTGATSSITRCPRSHAVDGYAYPVTMNATADGNGMYTYDDPFCLDGDYLVSPESSTISGSDLVEYRPEHNPAVRVVMKVGVAAGAGPESFLVEYPDGRKATYEPILYTLQRKVTANHANFDPSILAPLQSVSYAWHLTKLRDQFGNTMEITYRPHGSSSVYEVLPDTIRYTSFEPNGTLMHPALRRVEFGYAARPDPSEQWVSGVQLASTQLLRTITVSGPNPIMRGDLWTYTLEYGNPSVSGRSLLRSVRQCDPAGVCKPATTFDWELGASTFTLSAGIGAPDGNGTMTGAVKVLDANRDGLPDLLSYWPSLGLVLYLATWSEAHGLDYTQIQQIGVSGATLSSLVPIDLEGDGGAELIARENEDGGKTRLRFYRWSISLGRYERIPDDGNEPSEDPPYSSIYVADLDGDGLTELIRAVRASPTEGNGNGFWRYRKNNGGHLAPYVLLGASGSGGATVPIEGHNTFNAYATDLDGSGRSSLLLQTDPTGLDTRYAQIALEPQSRSSNGIRLFPSTTPWVLRDRGGAGRGAVFLDLNGDGMADEVEYPTSIGVENTESSTYFVNTGHGLLGGVRNFPEPTTTFQRIRSENGEDLLLVLDVNQDGRDDLVSAPAAYGLTNLAVFLSNGRGLSEPTAMEDGGLMGGPIVWGGSTTPGSFHAFDANGDGLTDFMMRQGDSGPVHIYLHDGKKADMITSFNSGWGASTRVTYSPWSRPQGSTRPDDCAYPVRCPERGLWVVSNHVLDAGWSGEDVTLPSWWYTYDLAAADMLGRGWLGFGERHVTYAGTGEITTYITANKYRRGSSYPRAHRDSSVQRRVRLAEGPLLWSATNTTFDAVAGRIDSPGQSFATGVLGASHIENEIADGGEGASTRVRYFATVTGHDAFGNVNMERRTLSDGTVDEVNLTYLNDTTNWILAAPTWKSAASRAPISDSETPAYAVRTMTFDYSPSVPRVLEKTTIEPDGDAATHLEVSITSRSQYGLPAVTDTFDRSGEHRVVRVEYDEQEGSLPAAITNAAGHTARFAYHQGLNLPIWEQDANGVETNLYYYPFRRLQALVPADQNVVTMSYVSPTADVSGILQVARAEATGRWSATTFDRLDRPVAESWTAMNGRMVGAEIGYDFWHFDKRASVTVPQFSDDSSPKRWMGVMYDAAGRVREVSSPDLRVGEVRYAGGTTRTIDPKGNESYLVSDEGGRVTRAVSVIPASDPGGAREIAIQYEYQAFGKPYKVTDAAGNVTRYAFDNLGRLNGIADPDRGNATHNYNAFGDVVAILESGGTTTVVPDPLGRPSTIVSPDGTTTYTWDTASHGVGMLDSATSPDGVTIARTYDDLARPRGEGWTIEAQSYSVGFTYDPVGRLATVAYPEVSGWPRFQTKYGYAANGELESLREVPASGTGEGRLFWKANARDEVGRVKTEELGNGNVTEYGVDQSRGVVTSIMTTNGTSPLVALGYDYDGNLNLRTRTNGLTGRVESFEYDALDRLRSWSDTNINQWSVTYGHDDIGNLTSRTLAGANGESESLIFGHGGAAGPHALTSSAWGSYGYDGRGNMTSSPEGAVDYTWFNLPKSIVGPDTTTFKYDAIGKRALKEVSGSGRTTLYAGDYYERRTEAGSISHVFYLSASGRRIGQVLRRENELTETVEYFHADALGSTVAVTNENRQLTGEGRKYDPFGATVDMSLPRAYPGGALMSGNVRLGFTGHEDESETGLINMRGRIYNPRVGHFLSTDPFVQDPTHPAGLNPYAYVSNNPVNHIDPYGFCYESTPCEVPEGAIMSLMPKANPYSDAGGGLFGGAAELLELSMDPFIWEFLPGAETIDERGKSVTIIRLPGGGWMRSDDSRAVHFQTVDGGYGSMGIHQWIKKYVGLVNLPEEEERVRQNLGEISENPNIHPVTATAKPSPMPVRGQATSSHPQGTQKTQLNPWYSGADPTTGAASELAEMAVQAAGLPTSKEEFLISAIGGPVAVKLSRIRRLVGATRGAAKALPALDRTGKVHGILPKASELGRHSADELRRLQRELRQSVQERIRKTVELGPDKAHGQRQAAEQELIRQIEKHLEGLQ